MNTREKMWYERYSDEVDRMTDHYTKTNEKMPVVCRKMTNEEIEERNKLKKIKANYPHRLYI